MSVLYLFVIDPQNDFVLPPGQAALSVPGAEADMDRLAAMVKRLRGEIDEIKCTLDMHHWFDVAHPIAWVDENGNHPDPFTEISFDDVDKQRWAASVSGLQARWRDYVRDLNKNGRYPLRIWPPHCLIGRPGSNVVDPVAEAFLEWEREEMAMVSYVTKGSNPYTEHYSGLLADVPDPEDETTLLREDVIRDLEQADVILLAGEAGSHCLANTVRDVANNFGDDAYIKKLVLLEDATSPVAGCEALQDDFIAEMTGRGMQVSNTVDFTP